DADDEDADDAAVVGTSTSTGTTRCCWDDAAGAEDEDAGERAVGATRRAEFIKALNMLSGKLANICDDASVGGSVTNARPDPGSKHRRMPSAATSVASHGHWRDAILEPSEAGSATTRMASATLGRHGGGGGARPTVKTWVLILTHCIDFIVLVFLGVAAALFRFGDVYLIRPQLQGVGGLCQDDAYKQPHREPAIYVPPYAVDVLTIVGPIVLVGVLEATVAVALHRQVRRTGASTGAFFSKRFAKSVLVFLIGLCVTSLLTDLLRVLVSRPRPYFLADNTYGYGFLRYCTPGERDARLSFPSYRCSVLAYAGAVVALRAERSLRLLRVGGVYVLRALALVLAVQPALLLASQALDSRSNHWQDIVVGLLLGAVLGAYTELALGCDLGAQLESVAAVPLTSPGIPVHTLPRPRAEPPGSPPPLTTAHLAAVLEESNGTHHHRHNASHKPDDVFY
ncbi:hypothetical protein FOCC_FOCC000879, partial [Frankliniella occidentalis]